MFLRSRGRSSLALAAAIVSACLSMSCGPSPNAAECAALLDRYVTLLASSEKAELHETELLRLRAEAREKAARDPAFRKCPERVSRRQFDCAMAAENADRFEQCLL